MSEQQNMDLEYDIRRTIILGAYMKYWGMPEYRRIMTRGTTRVEAYYFPASEGDLVARFATVGLSASQTEDGCRLDLELEFVVVADMAGVDMDQVFDVVFDAAAYALSGKVKFEVDTSFRLKRYPSGWKPNILTIDEARGEPEQLDHFHVGAQTVNLYWIVPLYEAEYKFMQEHGGNALDEALANEGLSVVDPRRESAV